MTIVTIQQGKLLGAEHQGYAEFLGVPYGAPPVGELRFRPPEAPSPWKGVRDARRLAAPSLQPSTEYDPCQGSEDCLYLNVYKPTGPGLSGPLPAMVWLHGGGFMNGSGNAFFGGLLAQTARAIIVTVNYRLGPFGWLALPSLAAEAKDGNAGNYGLLDNIAALAWVRTNIEAFGGDPERVTVFGQSAGGEQVFALLASPPARGLFQRAISMSAPAGLTLPELAASAPQRVGLLKTLNCADGGDQVARLRRVKAQELINAAEDLNWDVLKSGLPYVPTVGGPVLPGQWVDLFRENKFHHVPVMIGHTKQEGRLFLAIHENNLGRRVTRSDAEGVLRGFYPDAVEKISQEYGLSRSDDPGAAIADLVVDSLFATGLEKCRIALARHTKVFSYQTYDPNAQESHVHAKFSPIHAGHDSDLPPLFQWDDFTSKPASLTPEQLKYAIELGRYFGQFAANGDPNGPDLPEWRPMNDGYVQYIETESTGGTRSILNADYYKDHRVKFWSPLIHPEPAAN
ncbi:MAG: carboxylesterase family protein [Deltaproteobacteria bacterium]|nr:MAG: carboxylesterase family protein [Deltaproteobacteria bacterium]